MLRHFNPYSYQYSLKKELGISGRVKTIGSACGSGSAAIGSGYNRIRNGISRRVIAGGYEVLSPYIVAGFNSLMLLSKDRCKPFDKNRQGLNPGEGAAFLVLESAEGARKRGLKKPEFSIAGYGGALDSYHHTHAHPDGEGLASSISDAIMRAGISERDIDTIHFHGTATVVNDQSEYSACRKVFGNRLKQIPCFSTKSFTGHTFGASGAISTALSCFAASEDFAPGTLNCTKIDPEFRDLNVTEDIVTGIKSRYILITSLGFGGESFALILKKLKGVR